MDVMESVRFAMRGRIVPDIVGQNNFQREGDIAPQHAGYYIRETVMEYRREENFQSSELITVLCQYDVFVQEKSFPSLTGKAYEIGSLLLAEFNIKDASKIDIVLDGWSIGVSASVSSLKYGSASQEDQFYRLPVMIYIEINYPSGASYGG